ncbi:QRFP-like peptide receptor [Actinia tenebrosa]|uniref:QRFP-like peptide receptor n=1 Tax=Actinia tenebrosa TaxID=6105 RepID=A0A6P8HPF9_ACTTE|nr:QRFP-like peptide receptor [Actinia tenebrosa]XP_031556951.1 QRFP-like peptide receptor [Actinia tenebrosa]XP_031556952.1 QRFP-like peptide receptor [Actinia tenebrosa]XP_031556953.1 QRFP-like peptide receptor [Actinia tenebrosa]
MNNTTVEASQPYCVIWDSQAARIGAVVLYVIIFILSVVGNVLVVIVVYRNKSLRNSTNYFIVNMAVSDLLVPVLIISRKVKEILTQSQAWDISGIPGEVLCKVFYFLADVSPAVSILSLICISFNRFCAVMFPLRHKRTCHVPRCATIALTWLISFAALAPNLYAYKLVSRNEHQFCQIKWEPAFDHAQAQKAYTTFIVVAFIFIPMIVLSFIYINICAFIIRQKVIGNRSEREHAIRDRKTRSVVRLAITIVLATTICWAPYGVILLLYSFKYNWQFPRGCNWMLYYQFAQISGVSNAAINPAIYFIYVQNYKKELKRIVTYVTSRFVPTFSHAGLLTAQPQKMEMEQL